MAAAPTANSTRSSPTARCEFIGEFAQPFTLLVIADLLGVPESDHPLLREKLASVSKGVGTNEEMAHKPLEFLYEQFTGYIEERRRSPWVDVMGSIATATFPDGTLPEVHDVALIAANLFTAGQETTARMLGFAIQVLGERPDVQQQLRDDRSLIPAFIEEVLRLESPLKGQFRMARHTTDVAGIDIAAGDTVMLLPGAANRDPRMFECPQEFRLDRPNGRQHLAFGHGIHTCAGAPLAAPRAGSASNGYSTACSTFGCRTNTTGRRATATSTTYRRSSCEPSSGCTSSSRRCEERL